MKTVSVVCVVFLGLFVAGCGQRAEPVASGPEPSPGPERAEIAVEAAQPEPETATGAEPRSEAAVTKASQIVKAGETAKAEKPAPAPAAEKTKPETKPPETKTEAPKTVADWFEGNAKWSLTSWGDGAQAVAVEAPVTQGKTALRVLANKPKTGKVILAAPSETSGLPYYDSVSVDVLVEKAKSHPVLITIGLLGKTGNKFTWVESAPRVLTQGWNKNVSWNLSAPEWKTEDTGWHLSVTPSAKIASATVQLVIHGLDFGEAVVLDNLRIETDGKIGAAPDSVAVKDWVAPVKIEAGKHEDPDMARADAIRTHVLGTLAQYAADLRSRRRVDDANSIDTLVKDAMGKELVACKMK